MTEPTDELYSTDAYLRTFEATVVAVDTDAHRVALDRSAFYPGGGGQPADRGLLAVDGGADGMLSLDVTKVGKTKALVWHELADGTPLPDPGTPVEGTLDWERRHQLMRTHTALHILCGVIWADFGVAVTGGNMEPLKGRLDFELDAMSAELGQQAQRRINEEIERAREIMVDFISRAEADDDPALIRTKANLIPAFIDPLRVIDIAGLDRQADGGTHVATTAEVGRVEVTKTESKGKANKRIRLVVNDAAT
ncbi:alanyl-tRNA editing protein [Euzebya tangerina]|uniref:alanyl-tRNA editing protein n=1 Tax=Euzebya tangerina TaxID=591198 RepID=UPI000E30D872|nr:alanyl-tRNA editing protein [Euzebya tangerina]